MRVPDILNVSFPNNISISSKDLDADCIGSNKFQDPVVMTRHGCHDGLTEQIIKFIYREALSCRCTWCCCTCSLILCCCPFQDKCKQCLRLKTYNASMNANVLSYYR